MQPTWAVMKPAQQPSSRRKRRVEHLVRCHSWPQQAPSWSAALQMLLGAALYGAPLPEAATNGAPSPAQPSVMHIQPDSRFPVGVHTFLLNANNFLFEERHLHIRIRMQRYSQAARGRL